VLAARRLEDPGRTVEEVAFELEYPSGNALRNMLRRYTGLRPVDLRSPAGGRRVLERFRYAMRGAVAGAAGAAGAARVRIHT
jgi:AraC-like DNA-binding protein